MIQSGCDLTGYKGRALHTIDGQEAKACPCASIVALLRNRACEKHRSTASRS